jgi:hypothetical protein
LRGSLSQERFKWLMTPKTMRSVAAATIKEGKQAGFRVRLG